MRASAQDENLEALVEQSRTAMKAGHWKQALDLNTQAVTNFGQDQPLRKFGPQFGAVYYHKGICEMKLKKWADAMQSFEICYRDFPNEGGSANGANPFQILALCKWGESAMGAENWELAASRFAKFRSERDRTRDHVPLGSFYVNLAICEYRLGRLAAGNENLEIAIQNKENFPTPESGILAGFQALVGAAIAQGNEQVLLDFIGKNRGALVLDTLSGIHHSGIFLKLAGDAAAAGMTRAALALYQLVPTSDSGGADPAESIRLAAVALIHEKSGNVRGAYAAYEQLVRDYPEATNRKDHLFQLVRTAAIVGELDAARRYAGQFSQEYPSSSQLSELRTMGFNSPNERETPARIGKPHSKALATLVKSYPNSREFAVALDLYQGRKYQGARMAFSEIKSRHRAAVPPDHESEAVAAFYEAESMRKLGDWENLAPALEEIKKHSSLGGIREKQLELSALWSVVAIKNWEKLMHHTGKWIHTRLPADQRAQVAYLYGLALQNQGRSFEALNAYNVAMTADAGASEDSARQAAQRVLEIHHADPDVQTAIEKWNDANKDSEDPGLFRLREAAAVATLFEQSLGAGVSLPGELREFLKYKNAP
jgi:tetratricopeptide (TPR) repeat protein